MTYSKWVCIEEARGHLEGEIIRAMLDANDIPVQVYQESAGITYGLTIGSLGLVKIWVPEEFESVAMDLLQNQDDSISASDEE
jgi:hypothetical protein